jgi:hypothetical protein
VTYVWENQKQIVASENEVTRTISCIIDSQLAGMGELHRRSEPVDELRDARVGEHQRRRHSPLEPRMYVLSLLLSSSHISVDEWWGLHIAEAILNYKLE